MTVLPSLYLGGYGELEHESLCGWMYWDTRDGTGRCTGTKLSRGTYQASGFPLCFLLACSLMSCCLLILFCHINETVT